MTAPSRIETATMGAAWSTQPAHSCGTCTHWRPASGDGVSRGLCAHPEFSAELDPVTTRVDFGCSLWERS